MAERKAFSLLDAQARVLVVSPWATPRLKKLSATGAIKLLERPAALSDLDDAALVIAATDDQALNAQFAAHAKSKGALVNAVDDPSSSNFISPAVLQRGELTITISTGGASPALASELGRRLGLQIGSEYGMLVDLLGAVREYVKATITDRERREQFWKTLLTDELDTLLDLIRSDETGAARTRVEQTIAEWAREGAPVASG